jgi:hypothetical protein
MKNTFDKLGRRQSNREHMVRKTSIEKPEFVTCHNPKQAPPISMKALSEKSGKRISGLIYPWYDPGISVMPLPNWFLQVRQSG